MASPPCIKNDETSQENYGIKSSLETHINVLFANIQIINTQMYSIILKFISCPKKVLDSITNSYNLKKKIVHLT